MVERVLCTDGILGCVTVLAQVERMQITRLDPVARARIIGSLVLLTIGGVALIVLCWLALRVGRRHVLRADPSSCQTHREPHPDDWAERPLAARTLRILATTKTMSDACRIGRWFVFPRVRPRRLPVRAADVVIVLQATVMKKRRYSFSRDDRVRRQADFDRVYGENVYAADHVLVLQGSPNGLARARLGVSVSRRVGSAVVRNRWKRLIREAFRLSQQALPTGLDLVVRPRRGAEPVFAQIAQSLPRLARRVHRQLGNRRP